MGIDCMLFAEKAKRFVWVDRHHNAGRLPNHEKHTGTWWLGFLEGMSRVSQGDEWHESTEANRATARQFIRKHGEGEVFFVVTDHYEPSCHDFARANGYARDEEFQ